ncbi:MAG: lactate racemase domain-containing protein [Ignavibacteriales bacterium]|nr:lactate racemase domain-containing protein [Ignavibacteriales bacterium]
MVFYHRGSEDDVLREEDLRAGLQEALGKLGARKKVLAIPPDYTRFHSHAGILTRLAWEYYRERLTDILPALGTHSPMQEKDIRSMFGETPLGLFRIHDWRNDIVTLGEVPAEFIRQQSEGKLSYSWKAQVNKLLVEGGFDLILSVGQIVPHEVVGMAGHNKNIFVGTGGQEGINKSHFLGAVYGMERMMGRADTPVRRVLNYASENFAQHLPIVYVLTVVARGADGQLKVRGLFVGDDAECFHQAAALSLKVNFQILDEPLRKVVVYLDPSEFKSTWLGNKSVYRTRMAIADGGELIVLAPGLKEFGEDKQIDVLIRKYGYVTTPEVLRYVESTEDLKHNLSAAAHLIHGSSEGRFSITYCPGHLTKQEIESVNFHYADLNTMMAKYNPGTLSEGFNTMPDGEKVFFVSNPALGLWAHRDRFR